jgi:hypothetical protein
MLQGNWSFSTGNPWFLILIPLVLPPLVWWSYRSLAGLGPVRRALAISFRTAAITMVILALADKKKKSNTNILMHGHCTHTDRYQNDRTENKTDCQGQSRKRMEKVRRGNKPPRRQAMVTQRRQTATPAKEEVTFVEHKRLVPSPEEGPAKTPAMGKAKPTRPSAEAGRTNAVMEAPAVEAALEAALEAAHPRSPAPRTEPTYG